MSCEGWVELVLVRHGHTPMNEERRYQGVSDPGLSGAGRRQARSLADGLGAGLPADATVWCSSLRRSRETAERAFPGHAPRVDPRLDELDLGELEGRTHLEAVEALGERYERWTRDPWSCAPPGGEAPDALERRVTSWLRDLDRGRTHVAVTHLGPIRLLTALVLDVPPARAARLQTEPGSWARLVVPSDHPLLTAGKARTATGASPAGAPSSDDERHAPARPHDGAADDGSTPDADPSTARPVRVLADRVEPPDGPPASELRARIGGLAKPPGSLGRLEEVALRLARIVGDPPPSLARRRLFVFLGDHGVARHGVSAYPSSVTAAMAGVFDRGGAGSQALARACGVEVVPVDVGVDADGPAPGGVLDRRIRRGSRDLRREDALTPEEAARAVRAGSEVVAAHAEGEAGPWILAVGEMGIGNTTAASCVAAALTGRPAEEMVGPGTGVSDEALERKRRVVREAVERGRYRSAIREGSAGADRSAAADPLRVLSAVGGLEIAAMVGAMLEGARRRLPVLVDGFISTAAALAAVRLAPPAGDYLFAAHRSGEPGHRWLLDELGLDPILELDLRLGEGTGAVLAAPVLDAAGAMLREMAGLEDVVGGEAT